MGYLRLGIACCNFFAVAITAGKRFYLGDVRQKIKEISSCMRVSKRLVCFLPACLHGGGTRVLTQADADYYSHNGIGKSQIQLPE